MVNKIDFVNLMGQTGFTAMLGAFAGVALFVAVILFIAVLVWTIYWKGRALWLAARRSDVPWFILLLIINTLGILDIIYIYFIANFKIHPGGNLGHMHQSLNTNL